MLSGPSARDIYAQRLAERNRALNELLGRRDRIGYGRLAAAVAAGAIIWYAFRGLSAWWLAVPIAGFIGLAWWQSRVERAAECARRAVLFYEKGIARLENRWQGTGETGERFADPHHPYAIDLDLFGRASIFELLSTARTRGGESRLAGWLKGASPIAELRARHEAIDGLRPRLDMRERLSVLGDDFRVGVHPDQLAQWAGEAAQPFPLWKRVSAFILSAIAFVILLWWVGTDLVDPTARLSLIAIGLIEGAFGYHLRGRILKIIAEVEEPAHDLGLLSGVLAVIEKEPFESARLRELREAVQGAAACIARLHRLMELLESRENPVIRAVGPLVLWTTQVAMALEEWRAEHGPKVAKWLHAVAEIEALSSFANYAYEHPEDPFSELVENNCPGLFEGDDMGHPLLPPDRCITNSISLRDPLRLLVVSGSNMSGKSTLLRTVGVNAVLALAGGPVRAKRLRISQLQLGASIRTVDSLEEGHSRFMAEILRLKQVLELPSPAMFLLDELLHGTNSHDRALGSAGLVHALLDCGAIGLVTTHDLSLASVANDLGPAAANIHFEDRLEGGRLIFDYRIHPGVVERSNALDLMRAVGLDV